MKKINIIYFIAFFLAFCSIVYELLLGQSLAAFFGNTVLRYSVTIGLYLLSMGFGALLAEGKLIKDPVINLQKTEIGLSFLGASSIAILSFLNFFGLPHLLFIILAHTLIILIGILTGFEIPALIEIKNLEQEKSENTILGINYLGAVAGTLFFAFIFYPKTGLIATAFFIAFLNSLMGIFLSSQKNKIPLEKKKEHSFLLGLQVILLLVIGYFLLNSQNINEYFISKYLGI